MESNNDYLPTANQTNKVNKAPIILSIVLGVTTLAATSFGCYEFYRANELEKSSTTPNTSEVVSAPAYVSYGLDNSKIQNPNTDSVYSLYLDGGCNFKEYCIAGAWYQMVIDEESEYPVTPEIHQDVISLWLTKNGSHDKIVSIEFGQNVIDAFHGGTGQDITGDFYLFLLEDGSVSYLPIVESLDANDFTARTIPELRNIVKFYQTNVYHGATSGHAILAEDRYGNLFDVGAILDDGARL